MKKGFYLKMAWSGIWKNKRMYTPYILTCIGMVMMFYIVSFLYTSSVLKQIVGVEVIQTMLGLGREVIGVFALIFLFYTNSFLIRRRKKEFGLYNILGMGKRNLARILFWESLMIAVIALSCGLAAGITFSKFAELGMVNLLQADVTFSLTLESKAIIWTLELFAVIFALILLNTLHQIRLTNPIALLHSENAGEKPPKANWLVALVGAVILGAAYYLAVTIEDPVSALVWFFAAVIMVIIGTYLLFIAGSVVICKILQKKKNYYYKTNHFVSVSSMVYRMKRNGAGLASICILCTMVLVMLSSTTCLYIGIEDSMRNRYPRNINLDTSVDRLELLESEKTESVRQLAAESAERKGQSVKNVLDYHVAGFAGYIENGHIATDNSHLSAFDMNSYTFTWQIFVVSLEDYNRLMNQNETLGQGEVLLYTTKTEYTEETITIDDGQPLQVKRVVSDFVDNGIDAMQVIPSMYIIVPDFDETLEPMMELTNEKGNRLVELHWFYGFDLGGSDEEKIQIQNFMEKRLRELKIADDAESFSVSCEGIAKERSGFYSLYGGLFFLGILLSIVFLFAAVLIIYYKQISEGYEDQSRFAIMQKVGMTKKEIKKSINSQILTVFFLPLVTAGIHLAFAFPMLYKLLQAFGLTDLTLLILVTIACYLIFALFYVLVFRITSKAYYNIVSSAKTA